MEWNTDRLFNTVINRDRENEGSLLIPLGLIEIDSSSMWRSHNEELFEEDAFMMMFS